MNRHTLLPRFVRFCFVGGSGVFVDTAVLYLLADPTMLGWRLIPSKLCAAEVAMINNFHWNDIWTFRELAAAQSGLAARLMRFGKFNLVCLAGIIISVVVLRILVQGLGMNLYLANFVAIVVGAFWNFSMNYFFSWGGSRFGGRPLNPAPTELTQR